MLDRAAPLPDTHLDTPVEISVPGIDGDPTPRSLLARLVGQLAMWTAAVSGRPYDTAAEAGASVADLRRRLDEAGPAFLALFRDVAGGAVLRLPRRPTRVRDDPSCQRRGQRIESITLASRATPLPLAPFAIMCPTTMSLLIPGSPSRDCRTLVARSRSKAGAHPLLP
jgi:hypothetical protein